jgi:predicted RNA binding protein YcfA (HicA-like mRNA interferase family)
MKAVRRQLERDGFAASYTGGGHLKFTHPDMTGPVFVSSSPSDHRTIKNFMAVIRRKMPDAPEITTTPVAKPPPSLPLPSSPLLVSRDAPIAQRLIPPSEAVAAVQQRTEAAALDPHPDPRTEAFAAREAARRLGLVRYQGQPCIYGHHGERYTSSGACCVCGKEARRKPPNPLKAAGRVARQLGQVRCQGTPCRHGHNGVRYASSGACVACIEEAAVRHHEQQQPRARRPKPRTSVSQRQQPVMWWPPGWVALDER